MTNKTKRCALWVAVSSLDQAAEDKVSLEYQEAECRKLADERGYTVIDVLSVNGFSRSEGDLITALDELREQGVTAYDKIREYWQHHLIDVLVVYTDSRLGRSPSLYTHVFDNLLSNHIEIDTVQGGLIQHRERRMRNALGIISITADLDRLHDQYDPGMTRRMEKGRPVATNDTFTHIKLRDHVGNSYTYAIREEHREACNLIARAIIDRKSYYEVASLLATYGIRGTRGAYMWDSDVRVCVLSPISWGNIARKYKNKHGIWAFDDTVALPENVIIQRDTHEPMWTGNIAEELKDELRRRELLATGRAWPSKLTMFSGMLVCGYCGYRMVYQQVPKATYIWRAYCCASHYNKVNRLRGRDCDALKKSVRFETVIDWLTPRLERAVENNDLSALFGAEPIASSTADLSLLKANLVKANARSKQLLSDRADTPMASRGNLQELIEETDKDIGILTEEIARVSHKQAIQKRASVGNVRALAGLRDVGIDTLWTLPEPEINQRLYSVFGNHKLAIRDGEVADFVLTDGG